jgi:hypothetical protein
LWHSYRLTFTGNSRNLKVSLKWMAPSCWKWPIKSL